MTHPLEVATNGSAATTAPTTWYETEPEFVAAEHAIEAAAL